MRCPEKLAVVKEMTVLLHDLSQFVSVKEITRDITTLVRRAKNEGMSFLTKTLPTLGKAFDKALSGHEIFTVPTNFRLSGLLPQFMGSLFRCVFDSNGLLLEEPNYDVVRCIRTFLFYAYKIEFPFEDETKLVEGVRFIARDQKCRAVSVPTHKFDGERGIFVQTTKVDTDLVPLLNLARSVIESVIGFEPKIGRFAYGPGASADIQRGQRYNKYVPPSRLRTYFGRNAFMLFHEFQAQELVASIASFVYAFMLSWGLMSYEGVFDVSKRSSSKFQLVPKDSRGPRIICIEPSAHMYAQKALQSSIYELVARSRVGGQVNFTDQSINQRLTFDPSNATLDLKDASDMVSLDLVKCIFPPKWFDSFIACRTDVVDIPMVDSEYKMLKFAPMGNALCFPVMALTIFSVITAQIYLDGGVLPLRNTSVYVYGDDIIVRNEDYESAVRALTRVGLIVNLDKSFHNSRFRESCGQDTLDQSTVNPLRRRKVLFKTKLDAIRVRGRNHLADDSGYIPHTVSVMNQARQLGLKNLAALLEEDIQAKLGFSLPYGVETSPYLCKVVSTTEEAWRYNLAEDLERKGKIKAVIYRDVNLKVDHTNASRLRRMLREGGGEKTLDPNALGARKPYLHICYLKRWWLGAYGTSRI